MTTNEIEAQGYTLCTFEDDCDFCKEPKGKCYALIHQVPEDIAETEYYACEKCVIEIIKQEKLNWK